MEKNKFESSPILIFKKDLSPTFKPSSQSPQKKAIADLRIQVLKCNEEVKEEKQIKKIQPRIQISVPKRSFLKFNVAFDNI